MSEHLSGCGALARSVDPDRFYAALFANGTKREALFALIAFNHEVARIKEVTREPLIGEMRLAWWQEVMNEIDAGQAPRAHPVAQGLNEAYVAHPFSLDLLRGLIDARSFDVRGEAMADLGALEAYAVATGGGLARAMAEVLGADEEGLSAAEAAGTAFALTGLLRALRVHAARGQLYLPERELRARGTSPESVFAGRSSDGLAIVVAEVVALAQSHLERANKANSRTVFPAILPAALLRTHWRRLRRAGFDPFKTNSDHGALARLVMLFIASLRGKF